MNYLRTNCQNFFQSLTLTLLLVVWISQISECSRQLFVNSTKYYTMDSNRLDFGLKLNQTMRSARLFVEVELIGLSQYQLVDNDISFYLVCQYGRKAEYKYNRRLNLIHLLHPDDSTQQSDTKSLKNQYKMNVFRQAITNRLIFEDLSAFYSKKTKLFLRIQDLEDFGINQDQDYVISLIQINIKSNQQNNDWFIRTAVKVTVKPQDNKVPSSFCPFSCSGNGKCNFQNSDPHCVCNKDYIGEDCSILATRINDEYKKIQIEVTDVPKFYYFDFMPIEQNKFIITRKEQSQDLVSIKARMFNNYDSRLVLPYNSADSVRFYSKSMKDEFVIYGKQYSSNIALMNLKASEHKMTIIVFQLEQNDQPSNDNKEKRKVSIEIQLKFRCPPFNRTESCSYNNIDIGPICIVIYALVFFMLIVCCMKVKIKSQVSIVFIENYFPKHNYNYRQQDEEQCCPICLQEYKQDDTVRVTLCKHLIHQQCLDHWLQQKLDCPYCRTSFKQTDLQKWFSNQENKNKYAELVLEMINSTKLQKKANKQTDFKNIKQQDASQQSQQNLQDQQNLQNQHNQANQDRKILNGEYNQVVQSIDPNCVEQLITNIQYVNQQTKVQENHRRIDLESFQQYNR